MRIKTRNYRAVSAQFTLEQWRRLDDEAFSVGVPVATLLRHIIADHYNVPRETVIANGRQSFLDKK
jgi:hypothetical protein